MAKRSQFSWLFKYFLKLWNSQYFVLSSTVGVGLLIFLLRMAGLFEVLELGLLDRFFRWRPPEAPEERVVVISIDTKDVNVINSWPIPDLYISKLLLTINEQEPRLIGLDVFRDVSVPPGKEELHKTLEQSNNIIAIEKLESKDRAGVSAPPIMYEKEQVGFNDVKYDEDLKVRRNFIISIPNGTEQPRLSLSYILALDYLAAEGIVSEPTNNNFKLGKASFPRINSNTGAYAYEDASGYQLLSNFLDPRLIPMVSMTEVLERKIPPNFFKNKIVLIGFTDEINKDLFAIPYLGRDFNHTDQDSQSRAVFVSGVELHANFTAQILRSALDGRPILWSPPLYWEFTLIMVWAIAGGNLIYLLRSKLISYLFLALILGLIGIINYGVFCGFGWWIPSISQATSLMVSAIAITGYIAYQELELQRSKKFLQSVIDKIPDPIFVKDTQYRWIVLNQAFEDFIGYPLEEMLGKSEQDFSPPNEVNIFLEQDQKVLTTEQAQEHEEEFTNANGVTYLTETKRSIHKDGASNVFLIGVIRDITERKRMEEQLRRTAVELTRSNIELKESEGKLRYLANHDPLTGLANRKLFYESLASAIEWADNNKQLVGLLYLDLDGFKPVNDNLGHDMGDLLLQAVSQRIKNCLRNSDIVCRLGGDEFTVILHGIKASDHGEVVADKIQKTISQEFMIKDHSIFISTSIGISVYPQDALTQDELIKLADSAMYVAKQEGKGRFKSAQSNQSNQTSPDQP